MTESTEENRPPGGTVVAWRGLFFPGAECCSLGRRDGGWQLQGSVIAIIDGNPGRAEYTVAIDADWRTREVRVDARWLRRRRTLRLTVDADTRWLTSAGEVEAVRGCADVDLGITPSTNTLPIRRLGLAIGESANVTAAWVRFPDLTIEPLPQVYTRTAESEYHYSSGGGAFTARLAVDERGLVTTYSGGWERLGED